MLPPSPVALLIVTQDPAHAVVAGDRRLVTVIIEDPGVAAMVPELVYLIGPMSAKTLL
jgi:hypothetical protein